MVTIALLHMVQAIQTDHRVMYTVAAGVAELQAVTVIGLLHLANRVLPLVQGARQLHRQHLRQAVHVQQYHLALLLQAVADLYQAAVTVSTTIARQNLIAQGHVSHRKAVVVVVVLSAEVPSVVAAVAVVVLSAVAVAAVLVAADSQVSIPYYI